jgi:hypothetical protein
MNSLKNHETNVKNSGDDYAGLREPEDQNQTKQVGDEPLQGPGLGGWIGALIGLFLFGGLGVIAPWIGLSGVSAFYTGLAGALVGVLTGYMIGSLFGVTLPEKRNQH